MDGLYQELESARQGQFDQHVRGCARCGAELEALGRTRASFRALAEVDPPTSLTSILLHEAARRKPAAERVAGGAPGWWASLLRPLMQHPALAAAASLILVAGVAGSLYLRKGDGAMARPTAPSEAAATNRRAEAPAPAQTPPPEAPTTRAPSTIESLALTTGAGKDEAGRGGAASPVPTGQGAENQTAADDGRATAARGYTADLLDRERAAKVAEQGHADALRGGKGDDGKLAKHAAPGGPSRDGFADKKAAAKVTGGVSADPLIATEADGDLAAFGETGTAASNQPATEPAPADGTLQVDGKPGYRVYKDSPRSDAEQRWIKQQESQLSAALKARKCRDAAAIANDILDRDPEYYTQRVAGSKPVSACGWYVSDERSRRAQSRSKASKAKGGAPAQTEKAAAQPDKASDSSGK